MLLCRDEEQPNHLSRMRVGAAGHWRFIGARIGAPPRGLRSPKLAPNTTDPRTLRSTLGQWDPSQVLHAGRSQGWADAARLLCPQARIAARSCLFQINCQCHHSRMNAAVVDDISINMYKTALLPPLPTTSEQLSLTVFWVLNEGPLPSRKVSGNPPAGPRWLPSRPTVASSGP